MIRIAHIGAFNSRNAGDAAILRATRELFAPASFSTFDCQSTVFNVPEIEDLNDHDLILIGGGGLFWDRPGNHSRSGWQFDIRTDDLLHLKPPMAVFGCGWTQFPYIDQTDRHPEIANSLRALQARADLFSVRNLGTLRKLDSLGLDPTRIEVVPDVAFALQPDPDQQRRGIGLCWANDLKSWRWPTEDAEAKLFRACMEFGPKGIEHIETGIDLVRAYASLDLVLGMRKHSLIVPLTQGVPVIGLGHMAEVRWILEDFGLGDWLWTEKTPKPQRRDQVIQALSGGQPKPDLTAMRARLRDFAHRALMLAGVPA